MVRGEIAHLAIQGQHSDLAFLAKEQEPIIRKLAGIFDLLEIGSPKGGKRILNFFLRRLEFLGILGLGDKIV